MNYLASLREGIHPEYHPVVFQDGPHAFLSRSTMTSAETVVWDDGQAYPLVRVDVSSATHPFYTGQQRIIDSAGRVERFERRYGRRSHPQESG